MRKLLIVLAILTFATAAFAGDVTIQFNNAGGNSWNGVSTYPYLGSVNGVPTDFMCVSYNEHITGDESWQAMQYTVAGYSTLIGNPLKAEGLAYLYNQANLHPIMSASINAAAWAYNEGSPDVSGDPTASIMLWIVDHRSYYQPVEYSGVYFYVPDLGNQTGWTDGVPQTFLGSTPEPSTLLTLGSGLIGLAGFARKCFLS